MSTKLNPVIVTENTIGDAAFDGTRRRPVVAINEEGKLVVCCRRTAAKHGWKVEGTLHQRTRTGKKTTVSDEGKLVEAAATPAKKQSRRATDKSDSVTVTKAKVKAVKDAVDSSLEAILGK